MLRERQNSNVSQFVFIFPPDLTYRFDCYAWRPNSRWCSAMLERIHKMAKCNIVLYWTLDSRYNISFLSFPQRPPVLAIYYVLLVPFSHLWKSLTDTTSSYLEVCYSIETRRQRIYLEWGYCELYLLSQSTVSKTTNMFTYFITSLAVVICRSILYITFEFPLLFFIYWTDTHLVV